MTNQEGKIRVLRDRQRQHCAMGYARITTLQVHLGRLPESEVRVSVAHVSDSL